MVRPAHGRRPLSAVRPARQPAARRLLAAGAALPPTVLMLLATLLFALMSVCVKFASAQYPTGEIVFYRGLVGAIAMAALTWSSGGTLSTRVPAMHFWRGATGITALSLWFYSIGGLPLATAMTLNYMSSVWMALFLVGGAVLMGGSRVDGRLVATVLTGFVGVGLILRPTIERDQLWHGLFGLVSGVLSALAYLQVATLGRSGEPDARIVFYFSLCGIAVGAASIPFTGFHITHTVTGALLLLATGLCASAAQVLMTRAYAKGRTLVNASLQYLGIAYSFVFGALLFDDPVTPMAVSGMVLVVAAGLAAARLRHSALPSAPASTLET